MQVTFVAQRLGVMLFGYFVEIQRPHGGVSTGISRDDYENVTRLIRFRMYNEGLRILSEHHHRCRASTGSGGDDAAPTVTDPAHFTGESNGVVYMHSLFT